MQKSCEEIADMLVDYADGELAVGESSEVAEHLAKCERCRRMLKALQRSLDLAGVIWEDGLAEVETGSILKVGGAGQFRWRRYVAVAASILVVSAIWMASKQMTKPVKREPTLSEIESRIEDSARAARLMAATELLVEYPDCQSIVKQQYRYIVETYPETPAAAQAQLRIQ